MKVIKLHDDESSVTVHEKILATFSFGQIKECRLHTHKHQHIHQPSDGLSGIQTVNGVMDLTILLTRRAQ